MTTTCKRKKKAKWSIRIWLICLLVTVAGSLLFTCQIMRLDHRMNHINEVVHEELSNKDSLIDDQRHRISHLDYKNKRLQMQKDYYQKESQQWRQKYSQVDSLLSQEKKRTRNYERKLQMYDTLPTLKPTIPKSQLRYRYRSGERQK